MEPVHSSIDSVVIGSVQGITDGGGQNEGEKKDLAISGHDEDQQASPAISKEESPGMSSLEMDESTESVWCAQFCILCLVGIAETCGLGAFMPVEVIYGKAMDMEAVEISLWITVRCCCTVVSSVILGFLAKKVGVRSTLAFAVVLTMAGYLMQALALPAHEAFPELSCGRWTFAAGKVVCGLFSGVGTVIQSEVILGCEKKETGEQRLYIFKVSTRSFGGFIALPFWDRGDVLPPRAILGRIPPGGRCALCRVLCD